MSQVQITVRSIPHSETIDYHIQKHFKKISRLYNRITHCRVAVDLTQKHKHKGKIFSVRVDINIPGKELVGRKENQNIFVAIRDAFSATQKLLEKTNAKKLIFKPYAHEILQDHVQ